MLTRTESTATTFHPVRVLVTGGAGFIGSHVVERLLSEGIRVVAFDNFDPFYPRERKEANLAAVRAHANFTFIEGDIRDQRVLEKAFEEHSFDAVIHLAARPGVRTSVGDAALYYDINVQGTLNVLEIATHAKVGNFVFGASSSVYAGTEVPFREDSPADRPFSPYAATKRAGELLAFTHSHLYGLNVTCTRFFSVYGARLRPDLAIHKFCALIDRGQDIPILGDGSAQRDYTYISDIVDGVLAAMRMPHRYEIVNLGDSRTVPLLRVIELLETHLGKRARLNFLPPNPSDAPITYADISKAKRLYGYQPKVAFEEGIARFVEWYVGVPG